MRQRILCNMYFNWLLSVACYVPNWLSFSIFSLLGSIWNEIYKTKKTKLNWKFHEFHAIISWDWLSILLVSLHLHLKSWSCHIHDFYCIFIRKILSSKLSMNGIVWWQDRIYSSTSVKDYVRIRDRMIYFCVKLIWSDFFELHFKWDSEFMWNICIGFLAYDLIWSEILF